MGRELKEETGYCVKKEKFETPMYTSRDKSTCFFMTELDFNSLGHTKRVEIFQTRSLYQNPPETDDYGFALKMDDQWVICQYNGTPKKNQVLGHRGGAREGLELALQHFRQRHRAGVTSVNATNGSVVTE